jgi:acylphosphatase
MAVSRRVVVTGRVQGVFFRAWTKQQADDLGVTGWVRNRPDGSVEALVAGDDDAVRALIDRMGHGPAAAHVEGLDEEPTDMPRERGFAVIH